MALGRGAGSPPRGGSRKASGAESGAAPKTASKAASKAVPKAAPKAKKGREHGSARTADQDDPVRGFARGLTEIERIALMTRDELYGGSWDNMRLDLEARAAGRPYVFKLRTRIEEDLKAVEKLGAFEREHEVDLARHL